MKVNAITVCVEFSDLLAITLPRAAQHFHRILVVSDFGDFETAELVATIPNADLLQTNDFYLDGAEFNKGRALESGFDVLHREGWICIFDADILLPEYLDLSGARPGNLYTPRRRMLADISRWPEFTNGSSDFSELPLHANEDFAGYFQLFHAGDPVLHQEPWYETNWRHAGGADSFFAERWPKQKRVRPPFEVLHLGEDGRNWCGRCTPAVDGSLHPLAAERSSRLAEIMEKRRQTSSYRAERIRPAKVEISGK